MNILYLNTSDMTITDDEGNPISIDEARQVVESGDLIDCNVAFDRLLSMDFDTEALKGYYNETVH